MTRTAEHLAALWLGTLQRLTDHTAHDIRNALNGVAVNLEVVRGRAARGVEGSAIAPFAAAAAAQLEILTGQADALVTLLRPAGSTEDLAGLLGRLVALGRGAGQGTLELAIAEGAARAATTADPVAVRIVVGAALLEALGRQGRVTCHLGTDGPPTVYIECYAGGPLVLANDIVAAVTEAGIMLAPAANGITITFPSSHRE